MTSYLNRLKRELSNLKTEREFAAMADDFAYTNGTMRSYAREISRIEALIREEEGKEEIAA